VRRRAAQSANRSRRGRLMLYDERALGLEGLPGRMRGAVPAWCGGGGIFASVGSRGFLIVVSCAL